MKKIFNIQYFTIALILLIACAIFSADTGIANGMILQVQAIPYGDKLGHALLYGGLAFCLHQTFLPGVFTPIKIPRAIGYVAMFAVLEEGSQYWFPLRTLDAGDLLADAVGLGLAWLAMRRFATS